MKCSRYNFLFPLSDGTELFFNFYTLSLLAFKPGQAQKALRVLNHPGKTPAKGIDGRLGRLLAKNGFLVPRLCDEVAHLERTFRTCRSQEAHLGLTLLPTLDCNFKCRYCYERSENRSRMSRDVEDALIAFVGGKLASGGRLSVTWFGGEPLLCMDTVERLSRAFFELCASRRTGYDSHIVTNGYLLDGKTASRLKDLKVTRAQVTLDGPPEIHDRRKPLAGGGKTFRRIVDNLKEAVGFMEITIRMNVDAENSSDLGRLLDILVEEGLADKVGFYPGQTAPYTLACADIAGQCLGGEEFSLAVLDASLELTRRGLLDASGPAARSSPCGATQRSSYTVTPVGGIVSCWNDVAEPREYVGHLLTPPDSVMEDNKKKWLAFNPFSLACRECLILPICMGACPYVYLKTGKPACIGWKHHTQEHLLNYFRLKSIERQARVALGFRGLVDELRTRSSPKKS